LAPGRFGVVLAPFVETADMVKADLARLVIVVER
jgi:hypothetical protein